MKRYFISILFLLICIKSFSTVGNKTQLIQAGHWLYNDLYTVSSEAKKSYFIDNQPLSVGEIEFYLNEVEYETLSDAGKNLYDKVWAYLNNINDFFPNFEFRLYTNLKANPELYYKSNPEIPFSFDYAIKDRFLTAPIIIGFADYITLQMDLFLGKNFGAAQAPDNYANLPYGVNQFELLTPRFAYGSTGLYRKDWGVNIQVGKEGLTVGNTLLGSIIYNKTFESDFYIQINLFTKGIKYTSDILQVSSDKYVYLHQINLRPLKNLKFGCLEGTLLNAPFELRFLNPLTIMHGFAGWNDYRSNMTDLEWKNYNEGHFGAYLAFTLEYMPIKNLRLYGLYSQNEILDLGYEHSDKDLSYPDSLGGQFGIEYTTPFSDCSILKNTVEASYTSPYLYIKQSPDWSFVKIRDGVYTWMGSPFGPDCFALKYQAYYQAKKDWNISFSYLFKIHGENRSNMFTTSELINENGTTETIYTYYPYSEYINAQTDEERQAAVSKSRNMWMSGIREYTHQFAIKGEYQFLQNLSAYAQIVYTFIYNNKNIFNNFAQGIELGIGCEYRVLKV